MNMNYYLFLIIIFGFLYFSYQQNNVYCMDEIYGKIQVCSQTITLPSCNQKVCDYYKKYINCIFKCYEPCPEKYEEYKKLVASYVAKSKKVCSSETFVQSTPPQVSCTAWGDPHITTFLKKVYTCPIYGRSLLFGNDYLSVFINTFACTKNPKITCINQVEIFSKDVLNVQNFTVTPKSMLVDKVYGSKLQVLTREGTVTTADHSITIQKNVMTVPAAKTRISLSSNGQILNVAIAAPEIGEGICAEGCDQTGAYRDFVMRSDPRCSGLPSPFKEKCNYDVSATGDLSWANASSHANQLSIDNYKYIQSFKSNGLKIEFYSFAVLILFILSLFM